MRASHATEEASAGAASAALVETTADIYWELDAALRFVVFAGRALASAGIEAAGALGKTPWQHGTFLEDPWAAHRATLRARLPFDDFVYRCLNSSGEVRYLSSSGRPVFDARGAFAGYRGTAKDVSAHMRMALRLALEHSVARVLEAAPAVEPAMTEVIHEVCGALGWACGARDVATGEGLRCAETWGIEAPGIAEFLAATRELPPSRHAGGLTRRVWAEGKPLWIADVTREASFRRAALARECGLRSAFAFPIRTEGAVVGAMEFFSRGEYQPDAEVLDCMSYIGAQLGQFLQRKHAEAVLRESEARFRSLTDLSSDFYWETDAEHRIVATRTGSHHRPLFSAGQHFGRRRWELRSSAPDAAGWAAHRATLERHEPFRDFEFARIDVAGAERWLSISGEPTFDEQGAFSGYRGVGKDVTARKRAEQLRDLEHSVTRALAAANGVEDVIRAAIRAVCGSEGWACGRYFAPDDKSGELRLSVSWGVDNAEVHGFLDASRSIGYGPGSGLAGRVWVSGEPIWVEDLAKDERVQHSRLAVVGGIRAAFVFPVIADGRTIGVLAFNSREPRPPEERFLQAIRVIGIQIGQFVQRKQAEQVVRESEERFRSMTSLSSDVYWEQDSEFRFTSFTGMGSERMHVGNLPLGRRRWEQKYVNVTPEQWAEHIALLQAHKPFRDMELCRLDEKGSKIWVSVSGEPVLDADGRFCGYRGVGKDITARKLAEERIQFLANHDALTGLPNRAMFTELVNHSIHNARRYGRRFAVLFVDLDRFKVINDTLGHEAGDRVLKDVAVSLARTLRASDVVARLGGDEFVILVQEVSEAQQVEAVARKILAVLAKPIYLSGQEYRVTASIGICMYPSDAQDEQTVMKHADIAMYRAKEEGKNTYRFYSQKANSHSFERLALETSLRRGLERNEFLLHYQPKVDVRTGRITGVEALIRWQHPELGMVPPGQFIPLAEETGLIVPLGKWVLRAACAQSVAWQRAGLPPVRMSVNISARQFGDEKLLEDIAAALESSGLEPGLLELELTESMVMQDADSAATVLAAIRKMGVRLAIDDFGVGYSSLAQLKRFPIDTLKVDRSFIRDIPQDADDKAIAEAIIAIAKRLKLTVVAEGVETLEQQAFLREHDCDEMQGYIFSKPIPGDDFAALLRKAAI